METPRDLRGDIDQNCQTAHTKKGETSEQILSSPAQVNSHSRHPLWEEREKVAGEPGAEDLEVSYCKRRCFHWGGRTGGGVSAGTV